MSNSADMRALAGLIELEIDITSPDVDDTELAKIVLAFGDREWEMVKRQICSTMAAQLSHD